MLGATHSAVIVPVAEAEPVVGRHRRELDVAAEWGVPAHVTIVYPFVPPARIDAELVARLQAVIGGVRAFECAFTECGWFGEDVLWLAPDVGEPFRDLTRAVGTEFPEFPPYGGAYDDVIPHLTVGEGRRGTPRPPAGGRGRGRGRAPGRCADRPCRADRRDRRGGLVEHRREAAARIQRRQGLLRNRSTAVTSPVSSTVTATATSVTQFRWAGSGRIQVVSTPPPVGGAM